MQFQFRLLMHIDTVIYMLYGYFVTAQPPQILPRTDVFLQAGGRICGQQDRWGWRPIGQHYLQLLQQCLPL